MIRRILKFFKNSEEDYKVETAEPKYTGTYLPDAPVLETDWARMSALEQRDFFAENGFLVIPQAIKASELKKIHSEIVSCGMTGTTEDIWDAPSLLRLIENEKVVGALRSIFGEDLPGFLTTKYSVLSRM